MEDKHSLQMFLCMWKILQVSKQLPFLEYNLHSRLLNKMRMKGMNAIFNLRVRITVGDTMTVAIAVSCFFVMGNMSYSVYMCLCTCVACYAHAS